MTARLSWEQVCARRLARHGLTSPLPRPVDAVRAMAGAHAQVMSAVELSVGLRVTGATRLDVRDALWEERSLIKTFGPRGTVHLLAADDLPMWIGALSALPAGPSPFPEGVRVTPEQAEEIIAAIAEALRDAELTVDELTEELAARVGSWAADPVMEAFQTLWPRWRQVTHLAGHRGALCFGRNKGRKVTYTSPPPYEPVDAATAQGELLKHYLYSYGPSTPERFANWLAMSPPWARGVFSAMSGELEPVEVEGTRAWVVAGDVEAPAEPPRGIRLLPYFDGYAYRVGNHPPDLLYPGRATERVLPGNFQVLVVDGVVAGLWHHRRSGRKLAVTVEPLVTLTPAQRAELDDQVERVGEILEAKPTLTIGTVTVGSHA